MRLKAFWVIFQPKSKQIICGNCMILPQKLLIFLRSCLERTLKPLLLEDDYVPGLWGMEKEILDKKSKMSYLSTSIC